MIYTPLDCTADEALNGTTIVNTLALERGAHILRVHDVRAAVESVKLVSMMRHCDNNKK
jgi:dihydropteroate synthase